MSKGERVTQIIPAQPGFAAGSFHYHGHDPANATIGDIEEWFEPVIAWAISVDLNADGEPTAPQTVIPICVKGDMAGNAMIRTPDGQIKMHFDAAPLSNDEVKEQFLLETVAGVR